MNAVSTCFNLTALANPSFPLFASLNLVLATFMLLEGLVFGAVAFILFKKKSARLFRSLKMQGEVVEVREHNNEGAVTKHPVVRYRTSAGAVHSFESKFGSSSWTIKPGDKIDILVSKDDPSQAEVAHWMAQWGLTLVLGLVALGSLIGAPIVFFMLRH